MNNTLHKITGYELVKLLKASSEDCPNPERARLLESAAEEIDALITELKSALLKAKGAA
jgi:hypothetical protein